MSDRVKKIIRRVFLIFLVLLIVSTLFIGNFFINYALVANQGAEDREIVAEELPDGVESKDNNLDKIIEDNKELAIENGERWFINTSSSRKEIGLESQDGFDLYGHIFLQEDPTSKWAVIVHGYQGSEEGSYKIAYKYYDQGYNILCYDQRAMNKSQGDYITMGIKESDDLIICLDYIIENYPDAEIVTHGTSMGAATVLMASGKEDFPRHRVKAIIADCGYSSIWGVFESELYQRFEINAFPFLYMAAVVAIPRVGINIMSDEGNVVKYVENSSTPSLFIHGSADDFVPYPMVYELFNALDIEDKDLYIVEGAGHSDAQFADPDKYFKKVFDFIDLYI